VTNLRAPLVQALQEGLGTGWTIIGTPRALDAVQGPTVAVYADRLAPLPQAPAGHYRIQFTINVMTPITDPARADDALDESLSAVLALLWERTDFLLESAERGVIQDSSIHAWTLTVAGGLTITNGA